MKNSVEKKVYDEIINLWHENKSSNNLVLTFKKRETNSYVRERETNSYVKRSRFLFQIKTKRETNSTHRWRI